MTRFLIDTNVFVYARGHEHPCREPCRAVLRAALDGLIELEASVEVVQEYAHLRLRRGSDRETALDEADEVRSLCQLHPFGLDVLRQALRLLRRYRDLGVRDAVQAATAMHAGLPAILSTDRVFDRIEEVVRVDPAAEGVLWAGR